MQSGIRAGGPQLQLDDVEGLRYLYDPSFQIEDTCKRKRRPRRLLHRLRALRRGEGDCDRDSDCAAGLRCVQDIGAQFGFGPGIDVCR